jgi:hypothetical protein
MLQTLSAAGFGEELAFTAFVAVKSYVVGHVLRILGDAVIGQRYVAQESVAPEIYPRLASYLPYLAACDPDAEFERGRDVLIAGLEALASRARQ